jgi:S1-C subfamily serine protease
VEYVSPSIGDNRDGRGNGMAFSASRFAWLVAQGYAILLLVTLTTASIARAESAVVRAHTALPTLAPILKRIMPSIVAVASVKQVPDGPLPGNSGPLVNLRGEFVGINIIRLGSGLAFAVPVAAVRKLLAGVRLDG